MLMPLQRNLRSLVFMALLLPGTVMAASQADTEATNRQIVTQAFDRWAAGGSTFFTDVLAPDVSWTIKGSGPSAGVFEGRERFIEQAVRPFVSRLSSPVRPVSRQLWADGDHVVIHWDGVAVARDGQAYNNSYAWIFRMQDGKAVEVTAFLDLAPYDDVLRRVPAAEAE
ncbi:nuclear transport factor 2 family protein [Pseudomonas sp. JDS28PS106]|uniref:nuclear transport factor 2 family protein n=1 Tax=Pseudomonas sp. JDS28PS106 TaxID=2497235 RepID=UPI002FD59DE7